MASVYKQFGLSNILGHKKCDSYLLFSGETSLGDGFQAFLYIVGLAYCFIGLSAITARFFRSMENIVKHSRRVVEIDPCSNAKIVRYEKVWNYAIVDITLLAFGTSFPQISLATIDAIQNLGSLYAGGLLSILFSLLLPLWIGKNIQNFQFQLDLKFICRLESLLAFSTCAL